MFERSQPKEKNYKHKNFVVYTRLILFIEIFCCVCSTSLLFSQTPPYYHYTSSEGLASSQVYEMIQDRNGFMWFATANGVSMFDGHKFKNYTTNDGLNSNNIITLIEGSSGEIYFGNEFKGFNVYNDGKIEKYSHQTVQNIIIIGMFTDGDKLYSYYTNNISIVSPENTMNLFKNLGSDLIGINKMLKLSDGTILAAINKSLYKFENQEFKKISISGLDQQLIYWLCADKDNTIVLGVKGKIYEVKDNAVVRTIEVNLFENNNVIRLLKDSKGNIWFSIMSKGFYFIKAGTDIIEAIGKKVGLENKLVNNFLEDSEGNIWVSTYGEGVICLNNLYLSNYSQKDGLSNNKVLAIEKDQSGRMLIGTLDGLNVLEQDSFKLILDRNFSARDNMNIYGIKCLNDTVFVSGTFNNQNQFINRSYKNDKLYLINAPAFCITKNYKFINSAWRNDIFIQQYPPKAANIVNTYLFGDTNAINKVYSIYEDNMNNLWVGTTAGLCEITNGKKTFFPEYEILSTTIKSIIQDRNNNVWFAGDKGIASFRLTDSLITNCTKIDMHDMSSANTLSVDKYNRLWIGSMNGLFIFSNDNKDSVKVLNTKTGLPSNEILSLYYDTAKNVMWVGSANGLSSFDVTEFDNEKISPVKIQIKNVKADDSDYTIFNKIIFEPDRNNIQIDFTAVNYSSPSSVKYQYKLEKEWIDIAEDNVNFPSLKKGDYNLAIRGKIINSPWGEPALVSFTVLPYFTETFFFRASIVGLLILGIIFGAVKRIQFIKRRGNEQLVVSNQINDLKHQALSSMMNPHFIFNSLNSVQYLVNIDKKREANDYISLMAKLIRMNLDTASESYIRLDEEIKRLDLYLQIEKLRFSEKFNYEIFTGSDVDPESIMIPNMIIQPFVENSIWHGIMPSEKEGFIKLSFNFENVVVNNKSFKFFAIRITDNGIGLTEAQKNKKDGHISKGIQIIQERLILLSKEKNLPKPLIEDLNIKNKNTQGTEVVLSIPPELYKTIGN